MGLPAVAKTLRVDFKHTQSVDTDIQNHVYFQYAGAFSSADAITFAALCRAQWIAHTMSQLCSTLTLIETKVTDLTSNTAPQVVDGTSGVGGNLNTPVPNGVAFIIKFRIGRRYRGGHPKIYLPSASRTGVTNEAVWDSTYANAVLAAFASFIAAVVGGAPVAMGALQHVNVSYFSGFHNVTLPSGRVQSRPTQRVSVTPDAILGYTFNPSVASQRRRNETP